jgi:general secretion pathway protein D
MHELMMKIASMLLRLKEINKNSRSLRKQAKVILDSRRSLPSNALVGGGNDISIFALIILFFMSVTLMPADIHAKMKADKGVTFNFVDVDLPVIAKFVSEITRKNFILDERVKGKITIIAPTKLSIDDTFNLFTSVLEMKGFTVIPSGVDAYSIIPTAEAKQKGLKFEKDTQLVNAGYAARLIPLKSISAAEVLKLVQPIVSRDGYVSVFGPGNLLLIIDSGANIANILSIIEIIDKPSEVRAGMINIYFLENADATELVKVLENLIKSAQTQPQRQPTAAAAFESVSGISVTADKASNALIVVASPSDYQNILQIIKQLDKRRRQVFVEAMIAEIYISKLLELGTKWRATVTKDGEPIFITGVGKVDPSTISSIVTGLTGLTMGGLANYFTIPAGFLSGTTSDVKAPGIAALFSLSDFQDAVNVLSTPQILTSDNKEAEIIVGENVPFLSKRERDITTTNTVLSSIERRDIGITLKITPQINEGAFVKLDIYQEISALVGGERLEILTQLGPTFTKRATRTSVVVKDKQTVVIGGLMQERDEEITTKVPLLGDIPLLGWLFKYKSTQKIKINLLVFLTPHVVTDSTLLSRLSQDKLSDFTEKGKYYVEDELIVVFKDGVTEGAAKSVIAGQKAAILEIVKEKTYRIKLKKRMITEETVNTFSALPEVEKVEPVPRIKKFNIEEKAPPPPVSSGEKEESSVKENIQSTVVVPVEEKKPEDKMQDVPASTSPKSATVGKYAVQIKAYPETEKNAAMAFVEDVKKKEPDVHMERVSLNRRGVWYRVMVGHFANGEDASSYIKEKKMSDAYPGSFVQLKSEGQSSSPIPE